MTDTSEDAQPSRARDATQVWRDPQRATADRVADLVSRMTVEEKVHQLVGFWAAPSKPGEPVAPMQHDSNESAPALEDLAKYGLGQLTRVYGTEPLSPDDGVARLVALHHVEPAVSDRRHRGLECLMH